jgi:hypothetical protein
VELEEKMLAKTIIANEATLLRLLRSFAGLQSAEAL